MEHLQKNITNIYSCLADDTSRRIKMDLEGAELHALQGAEQTIRRYRPKLAVSIYHNPEDIWEIPELILKLHPDYRLYLRHYSIAAAETVVYAI